MFYCKEDCQKEDWKFHKLECSIFIYHYGNFRHDFSRLLLRLYLIFERYPLKKSEFWKIPNTDPPQYRCYVDLTITKEGKEEFELDDERFRLFEKCLKNFREAGLDYHREILFEHFWKILGNSFAILDLYAEKSGVGIYVLESVFWHSCIPNASLAYDGTNIEIRAMKNIFPGEKITINFVPLSLSREERQNKLKHLFFFNCSCRKCSDDYEDGKFLL